MDCIKIRQLEIFAYHGCNEDEKINIEEKTKVIKRLIDKNIDVFKRLAKK